MSKIAFLGPDLSKKNMQIIDALNDYEDNDIDYAVERKDCAISSNMTDYEDIIDNVKDGVIFMFDAKKFVENTAYRQEVWDQADFINRKCRESAHSKEIMLRVEGFYSYDTFMNEDKIISCIYNLSKDKPFGDLFDLDETEHLYNDNIILINKELNI
jgi:hypothetical protein